MATCNRVDQRDADGHLEATGVEWSEHCVWCDAVVRGIGFLSTVAGVFAFIAAALMSLRAGSSWWMPLGAAFALFSPIFWHHKLRFEGKTRQLLFHRDGRMAVPSGLPFYPRLRFLTASHPEVVSLEIKQTVSNAEVQETAYGSGVAMFLRNGDIVYVAKNLHPDDAQKVAVQLTQALAALRDDLAAGAAGQGKRSAQPKARGRTRPKVEVLID